MRTRVECRAPRAAMPVGLLLAILAAGSSAADSGLAAEIAIPHPMTMLLWSPVVHQELGLSADQKTAIVKAVEEVELPLWRLRDLPAEQRIAEAGPVLRSLRTKAGQVLVTRQLERLNQLIRQAHGIHAVFEPQVAGALNLSSGQMDRLNTLLKSSANPMDRVRLQRTALAVLTGPQQRALASLMGVPFDFSRIRRIACKAPEIQGVTTWIDSPALTLSGLRGKVVVVHFYTYGCINCIRNLPHYNDWRKRFAQDDLAIIGIHRPETKGEYDLEKVKQKAAEAGIAYPIAVDNESRNWDAWVNRVWPSVYLIDKDGFVRYWWYGELNWQGTPGEKWMHDRITELLAEPHDTD